MDVGTLLSAVQTLLASLQCSELKHICSILGYKSQLEDLKRTVETIKTVFRDAESVELSDQQQLWIKELKYAVYDADDLLDEFLTLAQQNKLLKGGRVSQKVRNLFSRFISLRIAPKFSRGVKEIRKRLDSIVDNHNKFGFKLDCKPIRERRLETCSYVDSDDIIGREKELEMIVSKLLDPNVRTDLSCLAIVGIGGLGKTALAQLIYNHPQIKENFPMKLWTCVSDEDPKKLDLKATLCKILHSVTRDNHESLSIDHLQSKVREELGGKKYLLVLDDVWNENRLDWRVLAKFLMCGSKGSWIVVTTRSQETASIVGEEHIYELKGLSDDDSWRLFQMLAFGHNQENSLEDLVAIGRDIVSKCANVPLAIRVVGSLLYGHEKEKWLSFLKIGLGTLNGDKNGGIEPILKLSYNHLDSPLKTCFVYCVLFPKDHIIFKEMLIDLWMAHDYIVPMEGQSVEDAGNEYISTLVKKCFFQDLERDIYGKIESFKIHDLMHDIAQKVVGNEIYATDFLKTDFDDEVRHLSYFYADEDKKNSSNTNKVRTCIYLESWGELPKSKGLSLDLLLRNWVRLRALDLKYSEIESLPRSLGKLLHLRYLDLSENQKLQMLPNSIGKLLNLQVLKLRECSNLKDLPKDLLKLVKLRVLDIKGCTELNGMLQGMGKLSCLQQLPLFVVGDKHSILKQNVVGQMNDLKSLENLRGRLVIKILGNAEYMEECVKEEGYIRNKEYLDSVDIEFPKKNRMVDCEEGLLLEKLQPHSNLRELSYEGCRRMPSWASGNNLQTFLPNLVMIRLFRCDELQHLSSLRKLRYLEFLTVESLPDLEYIEDTRSMANISDCSRASEFQIFFPSLKELWLGDLGKLKGWWREDEVIDSENKQEFNPFPSFPCLSKFDIWSCPNLTCVLNIRELNYFGSRRLPSWASGNNLQTLISKLVEISLCSCDELQHPPLLRKLPYLESLTVRSLPNLEYIEDTRSIDIISDCNSASESETFFPSLIRLRLENLGKLKGWWRDDENKQGSIPLPPFPCLSKLDIKDCPNLTCVLTCPTIQELSLLKSLSKELRILKNIESGNFKLKKLHIGNLEHLKSASSIDVFQCLYELSIEVNDELQHLSELEELLRICSSSLQFLKIEFCKNLKSFGGLEHLTALRGLNLTHLPKMVNLPDEMRYLTALESLSLWSCRELKSLPELMRDLTSLKRLYIFDCSESLRERRREGTGEDWPNIQHIPVLRFSK